MFKKVSESLCTSTIVVSPDPLFPAPSTSSTTKTAANIEEDPHDPDHGHEGAIQMEYASD
jgi:hypothetical protein